MPRVPSEDLPHPCNCGISAVGKAQVCFQTRAGSCRRTHWESPRCAADPAVLLSPSRDVVPGRATEDMGTVLEEARRRSRFLVGRV
jgi:hypothetical protein